MTTMLRLLFVVLLSIAGFTQADRQVNVWIPCGPEGGRIGRPVIDPRYPCTIYSSAGGRLYQTMHWNDLGVPSVTILAVDPILDGQIFPQQQFQVAHRSRSTPIPSSTTSPNLGPYLYAKLRSSRSGAWEPR
jgi:hypothetical protein